MRRRLLSAEEAVQSLAQRLAKCPVVARMDATEAEVLARAFADLEGEFARYLDQVLPRLLAEGIGDEELIGVLDDIGDQFRHILYHIFDPAYYDYLKEQDQGAG